MSSTTTTQHHHHVTAKPSRRWDSQTEIAAFGAAVYEHGLSAYPELIRDLAEAGRQFAPAAASVLICDGESVVARERALAVVSAAEQQPSGGNGMSTVGNFTPKTYIPTRPTPKPYRPAGRPR